MPVLTVGEHPQKKALSLAISYIAKIKKIGKKVSWDRGGTNTKANDIILWFSNCLPLGSTFLRMKVCRRPTGIDVIARSDKHDNLTFPIQQNQIH